MNREEWKVAYREARIHVHIYCSSAHFLFALAVLIRRKTIADDVYYWQRSRAYQLINNSADFKYQHDYALCLRDSK
jgi:hypothetical protein